MTKRGESFLLNARGSLIELTDKEAEAVSGSGGNIAIRDDDISCNSYTNSDGCDYNTTEDY